MDQQHGDNDMPNAGSRQTVASVAAQQGQLEGRITGLERDMQNMSQAVASLTTSVQAGFAETRRMLEESDTKNVERLSEMHARIDQQLEKSADSQKMNWGVAVAVCSLIWAVVVAIVAWGLTQSTQSAITRTKTEELVQRVDHLAADTKERIDLANSAILTRVYDNAFEIEKLHGVTDNILSANVSEAERLGYLSARVDNMQKLIDISAEDRFRGREGAAMEERISALEAYLLESSKEE